MCLVALAILPSLDLAQEKPANAPLTQEALEELWVTGSLWQVGDNIPKVEAARKELIAAGDAGMAFMLTKLATTNGLELRCLEVVFVGYGAKAIPALIGHLNDEPFSTRRNVATLLGSINDTSAAPRMIEHLKTEVNIRVKATLLAALAKWKIAEALDPLIEASKTENERVRMFLTPLLAGYQGEKAVSRLLEMLDDPAYFIRDAARDALIAAKADYATWARQIALRFSENPSEEAIAGMGRRVSLVLDVTFRLGEYREFQEQLQGFLRSPHAKIRGDAALFLAARGRAIWEEAKSKPGVDQTWNPADQISAALGAETDPYVLASLEKALAAFSLSR